MCDDTVADGSQGTDGAISARGTPPLLQRLVERLQPSGVKAPARAPSCSRETRLVRAGERKGCGPWCRQQRPLWGSITLLVASAAGVAYLAVEMSG
ncbi:hypothetical protein C1Y40_04772 [Mycobacterium talmoniae]|uniref:Uncharacterized protein n=1 Tax=Mycobacterium talmoniae TaxID=1858794 RepID=A0A2S8BEJ8_9MYCO|nr:hypothetical protein C1Y40_04772 [Mycobacterium talmoniae]